MASHFVDRRTFEVILRSESLINRSLGRIVIASCNFMKQTASNNEKYYLILHEIVNEIRNILLPLTAKKLYSSNFCDVHHFKDQIKFSLLHLKNRWISFVQLHHRSKTSHKQSKWECLTKQLSVKDPPSAFCRQF